MRDNGTVFEVNVNGRTVATASVVEGENGLPEIRSVDVLPGYEGIAPDEDLYEMVVDHARKKYPSARAPRRARKTDISTEGFASIGPEHHDARGIVGTPGTPEYAQAVASEFEAARASGKRVFFDYNNETREVQVTEVYEKNGFLYMKGNDALRNGEERVFRLDRVSMPKIVRNPATEKKEVAKKPPKRDKPRRPVPIFTGKAKEIFEGAESWEEVAERLGKGRYVFFDFETTGIEEGGDGLDIDYVHPGTPTQIGLVEIVDGKVTRRWSTHVNPGRPMSVDPATGRSWSADNLKYKDPVTGELMPVTDEWLSKQKPLKEALEEMLEFIGPIEDTILGGQNHPYDNDVMKRAMIDSGLDPARWNPGGFIDSQALAQSLLDKNSDDYPRDPEKGYKTVSLGPLATFLGHDMGEGWHSADVDSEASWEAFSRLVRRAADHENAGKPVRRDLLDIDGGEKEHAQRMEGFENEKRGWEYKVKTYREAVASETPGDVPKQSTDGFASRGSTRSAPRRRAKNPAHWENMTPEQRDAATKESAEAAVEYLDALADVGIDVNTLRDLDRAELDAILRDLIPGGEARVSDYVTGDGKALIEVSNATMGKVFMAMGFHVQVNSDDPNEHHILENGIDDMQKALQDYVKAIAKDPESLRKDRVFRDWAGKNGIDVDGLSDKKLEKAAKAFAEKFEINMCLYYKSGTNMLCGANIGIRREEMPQIGGRMKGDDTLAAKAIKAGLMKAKEFAIDDEKLKSLDPAKQDELRKLAKDTARVMELARSKDPLAKELFDVLNWNNTEANAEEMIDRAAGALGIAVDVPRFVDPETMLGAQNELQGSKVEKMADAAVKAVLEAVPVLEARLGRKPTNREISEYLANEVKHGLFQPTLTAGLPGGQIYMLDGHHRWAGLLMANRKLEAMGFDVRAELNIKNYQTDIRSGLELGRAIQVAMGIKDAKLAGEDIYKIDSDIPDLTPEEFSKAVAELLDKKNLIDRVRKVREGGKFRETEAFDELGQRGRLSPRRRPVKERVDEVIKSQVTIRPQSRVKGEKARSVGYRAAGSGSGWQSVEDHIALETERGNELFETHKEYLGKGYETAWVTHTPDDAGRYVVAAGDVPAWEAGEIEVKPEDIAELDLSNATLVGTDDEGGFLYVRKKPTRRTRERIRELKAEEEFLDEFALPGGDEGFASRSRTRVNRRGLIDRFLLERKPVGEEARKLKLDTESLSEPEAIGEAEFYEIVGTVPGLSASDELVVAERLTSSRVKNLEMFRGTFEGKKGRKNRVFGRYTSRDGTEYSIAQDQDGIEGRYYAYLGPKRLDESESAARLVLILNDGELNVHDIFSVNVNEEYRKSGLAQAMVEVAKADFPDASFQVRRVVTEEGAAFARNLAKGPELASAGKQSQVQRIIDGGWTASADDLRDARRLIDEIEGTIGKKKADALRKKLDELEKERRELVDSLGIGKPSPFPVYRTGDTGDARRRPELSGLTDGGFGVRTGDPEKDRQIQEEMNARRRQQDEMLKVLEQVLEQTHQTFDDWSNGFSADDEGARAADNWSTKKRQNMDRKAWSNIDPETGKPTIGTPIYEETIRMGPSGLRGRATYKFKADDEGFVAVYKKGSTKPIATLMVDREFTHEGGLREPRSDRHHIENIFVDEAHRRRGIATEMARIAEHVYGGRVEHSSMLTTLGKKFRDADVERRGTPANPSPFEDEFGNRIVPVGEVGFASRGEERGERPFSFDFGTPTPTEGESRPAERPDTGNYVPMPPDEDDFGEPSALDRLADKLGLDKPNEPDTQMSALTAQIMGRIAGGEASLAERLGITPQQLAERFREIGDEINRFVDRFVNDKDVRANVKLGYKLLKAAAIVFGMKGMKDFLMMVNPDFSFGGSDSGDLSLLDIVDSLLGAGIHQALLVFGLNFANLIASEYAAMRLVTRRKAKRMVEEIRARIEGSGQYIGTMSREMWDRLRGAWAKTRARAPIPVPAGAKQWIVAGSSPIWAELSWSDYQTKSRITQKLAPTDRAAWQRIATKVGQSPELIDIVSYRAGLGYGHRRVKSRDVVRVYL
jgi:DNA polymerase III epsilon subunit-like protein/ribosomal protein S18 acetylase RimI-like enzyme/ParB-like chromosome segregation protein Spo0J